MSFCLHGSWYFRTVASHCHFFFQWCCLKWRTDSENIGCQETMGAHIHLQCYHLICITNKYNFHKKVEGKRCNSNFCNNYFFIYYSIHVWFKSVRSLTQIRIKKYIINMLELWWTCFATESTFLWIQTVFIILTYVASLFVWRPSFNFTYRYIDDFTYKVKKETTVISSSASYRDLHIEINSLSQLRTKLYFLISHCELSL